MAKLSHFLIATADGVNRAFYNHSRLATPLVAPTRTVAFGPHSAILVCTLISQWLSKFHHVLFPPPLMVEFTH
jgi:hypothetical protein